MNEERLRKKNIRQQKRQLMNDNEKYRFLTSMNGVKINNFALLCYSVTVRLVN